MRPQGFGRWFSAMGAAALLPALALCALTAWGTDTDPVADESSPPAFREIWAYLLRGEEEELTGTEPITDLCYFGAGLTKNGRLSEAVARPAVSLRDGSRPAVHLVVSESSNSSLMHFSLDPQYGVLPVLVDDICRATGGFDGVQIDFEAVSRDDADHFIGFLMELRRRLPVGKKLSVAVPARVAPVADAYEYTRIAPTVDRMIVMAYDEHWSTSSPGPIASLPWCAKVVDYVRGVVARDKIVMGLPLYGRAWQDKKLARALRFTGVQDLVAETNSTAAYEPELGFHFEYSESVVVSVFYEDDRSILEKLRLYQARDVSAVSFWRIGQGSPRLWSNIRSAGDGAPVANAASAGPPPRGGQLSIW